MSEPRAYKGWPLSNLQVILPIRITNTYLYNYLDLDNLKSPRPSIVTNKVISSWDNALQPRINLQEVQSWIVNQPANRILDL